MSIASTGDEMEMGGNLVVCCCCCVAVQEKLWSRLATVLATADLTCRKCGCQNSKSNSGRVVGGPQDLVAAAKEPVVPRAPVMGEVGEVAAACAEEEVVVTHSSSSSSSSSSSNNNGRGLSNNLQHAQSSNLAVVLSEKLPSLPVVL